MMRKILKKAALLLIWSFAILTGLYFCLLLIVHLPPVQRFIIGIAEKQSAKVIDGTLSINSYFTNLLSFAEVYSVRIKSPDYLNDTISIDVIHANYNLLSLLKQKIALPYISATGGKLYAQRDESGVFRIPGIRLPLQNGAQQKKSDWKLEIGNVCARKIDLSYLDKKLKALITLENIQACAGFDPMQASISSEYLKIQSPQVNTDFEELMADVKMEDSILHVSHFSVNGSQLQLSVKGEVPFTQIHHLNLWGQLVADMSLTDGFIPMEHRIRGAVSSQFEITGNIISPVIKASFNSSSLLYRNISIDTFYLQANLDQHELLKTDSYLQNSIARADIQAEASLKDVFRKPVLKEYNLTALVDGINLGLLAEYFHIKKPPVNGTATANLLASGYNLSDLPENAELSLAVSEKGSLNIDTLWFLLNLENNFWSLQSLLGHKNYLHGQGKVRLFDKMEGSVEGTIKQPSILSSLILKNPIKGVFSLKTSFTNLFQDPDLSLSLFSDLFFWRGFRFSDFDASINYDSTWNIDSLCTDVTADLQKTILPDIKNLQGILNASIKAQGKIFNPVIQTKIKIADPLYQNFKADSLFAALFYNDKQLLIDSLTLHKDTLVLRTTGNIDLLDPGYSLQSKSVVQVRNNSALQLRSKARYVRDTVLLKAVVDYARIGLLLPQIPLSPCVDGSIQVNAVMDKQNCLHTGNLLVKLKENALELPNPFLFLGSFNYGSNGLSGDLRVIGKEDSVSVLLASLQTPLRGGCMQRIWPLAEGSRAQLIASDFEFGELIQTLFPGMYIRGEVNGKTEVEVKNGLWYINGKLVTTLDTLYWASQMLEVSGVKANAVMSGWTREPNIDFSILSKSISLNNNSPLNMRAYGNISGEKLRIDSLYGNFENDGYLRLQGLIPLKWKGKVSPEIEFEFSRLPLAMANNFIPTATIKQGNSSGKGKISTDLSQFKAEGNIAINGLQFYLNNCNGVAGPFQAYINLKNDQIILDTIHGKWGDGSLNGKGDLRLSPERLEDINTNFTLRDFNISCQDAVRIGIENAFANVYKKGNNYRIDANIKLDDSRIEKMFTISGLFESFREGEGSPSMPSAVLQKTILNTVVDLNSNLLIDTNLGRFLLDGRMNVSGPAARPSFNGVLNIEEGRIRYLDRDFEIQEGTLFQFSAAEINPTLEIEASSEVQDFTADVQPEYTVNVMVRGTMRNPSIRLSSNPSLDQQQIINLLTFGGIQGSPGFQTRGGQILSSYVTGLGSQYIEEITGLSNVSISGNIFAQDGGLALTVSQNLTSRISVSYQTDVTDIGQYSVQVMYRLFPQLRLIGRTDSRGNSDAGVKFIYRR